MPLLFVLWFGWCFMAGGDGIFFALMLIFPTILVEKMPLVAALFPDFPPLWWQWTLIFVCGYAQWLLINYLGLKALHFIKGRSANRQAS